MKTSPAPPVGKLMPNCVPDQAVLVDLIAELL